MLGFVARSVAVAVVPFVLFFGFCSVLSSYPSVATTLSLEKWARVAYQGRPDHFPDCLRYDTRLTYLLRPGRCRFARAEFDTELNVNSFGLRDDEESLAKPKIIVLGDSHTMGHGVGDQEAFPQVLERLLKRKVLNAGVSSFGTARELMLLRLLDTTEASVIVIQYCHNDFEENQSLLQHGKLPLLSKDEYEQLLRRSSAIYLNLLGPGLEVLREVGDKTLGSRHFPEGVDADDVQANAFLDVLARSADLLRGRHVLILNLPDPNARFIDAVRSRSAHFGLDLTFADVNTVLTPQDYFILDPHMRSTGHEKVAALLARIIGGWTEARGDARGQSW